MMRWRSEDAEAAARVYGQRAGKGSAAPASGGVPQGDDPWSPAAWAAAPGPLLPPNDPRASMEGALQAGALG
eukprot:8512506-Alexandrium_andersonii.AAC.1